MINYVLEEMEWMSEDKVMSKQQTFLTLVFGGLDLFVLVTLFSYTPTLVAARVAICLQHIGPGHLAIGTTLAPRRLFVAAS